MLHRGTLNHPGSYSTNCLAFWLCVFGWQTFEPSLHPWWLLAARWCHSGSGRNAACGPLLGQRGGIIWEPHRCEGPCSCLLRSKRVARSHLMLGTALARPGFNTAASVSRYNAASVAVCRHRSKVKYIGKDCTGTNKIKMVETNYSCVPQRRQLDCLNFIEREI